MLLKNIKLVLFWSLSWLFSLSTFAQSESGTIYLDVGQAYIKTSLIAIPPFRYFGSQKTDKKILKAGVELYNVVKNNTVVSGFFTIIDQKAYLEDTSKTGLKPKTIEPEGFDFANWIPLKTDFLIRAGYQVIGDNIKFEVYTYHIPQGKLILGRTYESTLENIRTVAHTYCDDLMEALTGRKGMFNSKVVVSIKNGSHKEINIMDWDGANIKQITNFKNISISPSWSSDGKQIAFTSFAYHPKAKVRNADLFTYELSTGKTFLLSSRKGINSGSTFHPNGKDLYFTISKKGNPDIYKMDLATERLQQQTDGPLGAMNVEPSISPDGKWMAFSSDRSGRPMIYMKKVNSPPSENPIRLINIGRYNSTPDWSPDGKRLAFAGFKDGHFDVYILDIATRRVTKKLTAAKKRVGEKWKWSNNTSPTFSPDGRFVMYASDRWGPNQIYIVDVDGRNIERRVTNDNLYYDTPKWQKRLN